MHKGCALADKHSKLDVIRNKLEYKGKIYGVLGVSTYSGGAHDEEEKGLFLELCSDIAFALANIEQVKQLKESAETRREMEVLKKTDELRSQFISNVSHELRTPLTSIKGFTSTLLRTDTKWSS